ncbi:MAG: heavy-metal-associated domain-containing protein [Proteobacteria bacterium]|nr:heavy-metal-associated domain-containing protein [Pseudomonadota bacterium]
MKTTVFKIQGMNCDACAQRIKGVLEANPAVRMASVSFAEAQARVLYDPQAVQEEFLIETIRKSGFRVVASEALGDATAGAPGPHR